MIHKERKKTPGSIVTQIRDHHWNKFSPRKSTAGHHNRRLFLVLIRLILEGRMNLPSGADVPTFLLSDGKLAEPIKLSPDIQVGELLEKYQLSIPNDTLEKTTLSTFGVHMRHIVRLIGGRQVLSGITKPELQKYVTARSNEPGRRGNVSATTIRKELGTFGALWNWAKTEGFVDADFPRKGLLFPKQTNKPAFQTWEQIQKQISENELADSDVAPLWDCLYRHLFPDSQTQAINGVFK